MSTHVFINNNSSSVVARDIGRELNLDLIYSKGDLSVLANDNILVDIDNNITKVYIDNEIDVFNRLQEYFYR